MATKRNKGSPLIMMKVVVQAAHVHETLLNRWHASGLHHRNGGEPKIEIRVL